MAAPIDDAEPSNWDEDKETLLVSLWQENPCLYNTCHKQYKDRTVKAKIIRDIAARLEKSVVEVERRMKSWRTVFSKACKIPASGSERKPVTKKTTWIIENLQFLRPFIKMRATTSNFVIEIDEAEGLAVPNERGNNSDEDPSNQTEKEEESNYFPTDNQSASTASSSRAETPIEFDDSSGSAYVTKRSTQISSDRPRTKQRRQNRDDAEVLVLQSIAKSLERSEGDASSKPTEKDDDVTSFCSYVGHCMHKMDQHTRNVFRFRVNNLIFEAQCGQLQQFSYTANTQSDSGENNGSMQSGHFTQMLSNNWSPA